MVTFLTGRPPLLISSARATKPALIRAPTAARVTALHIHDFIARILSNRASACRRGGSNPYTFRYRILSPARLPIPPLLRFVWPPDYTTAGRRTVLVCNGTARHR